MNLQLTGKTVLITGASKGIGLAAAHALPTRAATFTWPPVQPTHWQMPRPVSRLSTA